MEGGLKPIVVINKIDRDSSQISEALRLTQDLFLELATNDDQLDFPVLYASGRDGYAVTDPNEKGTGITPILDTILETIPPPAIETGDFQMLISNLDYDNHKGKIVIGRIWRGSIKTRDQVVVVGTNSKSERFDINAIYVLIGLKRLEVTEASAGDIVALTGIDKGVIGDTVTSVETPEALPRISIGEPTVEMTFGVNTSPFGGREGRFCTTRQIRERLYKELETNLSLKVSDTDRPDTFMVKGRGELHLAILIETMRREGYEFEVSKPEAVTKMIDGKLMEPVEMLTVDIKEEHIGIVTELLSKRQAQNDKHAQRRARKHPHGIQDTGQGPYRFPQHVSYRNTRRRRSQQHVPRLRTVER